MSKISLKHSGGNVVSLNSPTSAPTSADVAFKLPNADGSTGQFMKTDGSGNLSFGAPTDTNDYVKLQHNSASSANQYLVFNNLDVATYKYFDFNISYVPVTDNSYARFRFRTGTGSATSGSDVIDAANYGYSWTQHWGTNNFGEIAQTGQVSIQLTDNVGNNNDDGEGMSFNMRINFANSNDTHAANLQNFITYQYAGKDQDNNINQGSGRGAFHGGSTYPTGFQFYMNTGSIAAHTYTLYGMKR
jgi:Tfp pilus assembly protein FimT